MKTLKMHYNYAGMIVLLLFSSCSKTSDNNFVTLQGAVLDYVTNVPFPETKVVFRLGTGLNQDGSMQNEQLDSVYTDNQGKYTYQFDQGNYLVYRASVEKTGCIQAFHPGFIARMIVNDLMSDTLFIGSTATLQLNVINNDPNDGDQISIIVQVHKPYELESRDLYSTMILANMGYDPNNCTITREYFYDLNPTIGVDVSVTRLVNGIPFVTEDSITCEMVYQGIKAVPIAY